MRVLVLGAYGMIGEAVAGRLAQEGMTVTGLGRDLSKSRRIAGITWIKADLSRLLTPQHWAPLLENIDAIVNAAGALQDGAQDNVRSVHEIAIIALVHACETARVRRFVQISAVGAEQDSAPSFFRTKAVADAALMQSSLEWVILRPGLVIGPTPYGSTALLRGLASIPYVQPVILADRPIQTVSSTDVANAVADALTGKLRAGTAVDLVEDNSNTVRETVAAFRAWLGLPAARIIALPKFIAVPVSLLADLLGWLGWRSPLRSTAMRAIDAGVTGDPAPYSAIAGHSLMPLRETLAVLPRGVQEIWFARLYLLKPLIIGILALFWIVSGIIALTRFDASVFMLRSRGISYDLAYMAVLAGSVVDIALGASLLLRKTARLALIGMIAVTLAYLGAATLLIPALWLDPLGALVKTVPTVVLALVALAVLDDR